MNNTINSVIDIIYKHNYYYYLLLLFRLIGIKTCETLERSWMVSFIMSSMYDSREITLFEIREKVAAYSVKNVLFNDSYNSIMICCGYVLCIKIFFNLYLIYFYLYYIL